MSKSKDNWEAEFEKQFCEHGKLSNYPKCNVHDLLNFIAKVEDTAEARGRAEVMKVIRAFDWRTLSNSQDYKNGARAMKISLLHELCLLQEPINQEFQPDPATCTDGKEHPDNYIPEDLLSLLPKSPQDKE